ncbi:MAG: MAPEG family protein, partial [Rhodospirillales bacterium]|nr:MAPEG family protein [Rhodospirillales bacterium]
MTTPLFILLGFAGWTLLTLLGGVSILRWRQILNGTATFTDFPADTPHGSPAYR